MPKYTIWDPDSHEHLAHYNRESPGDSFWTFLDSDTLEESEIHTFNTEKAARVAAKRILQAENPDADEDSPQFEVRELQPVFFDLGCCGDRVEI